MNESVFQNVISLAKRRGFIFPGSEIYGGLANAWDFGPLGVELKNNIKQEWWRIFVSKRQDIVGMDSSIIMNPKVWEASGHIQEFTDLLVEDEKTRERFRLDHLLEESGIDVAGMSEKEMMQELVDKKIKSPKGNNLSSPKHFNLMFETYIGSTTEKKDTVYLRPETAQAMFVNFKNVISSTRVKLPFGIAQIGKAFRNEITPGNYIFRTREFEQMEIEYFVEQSAWEEYFEKWLKDMDKWIEFIGLSSKNVHHIEVPENERAHYSSRTVDFEYDFPFGRKELYGLAYRSDYDLMQHAKTSKQDLAFTMQDGEKIVPHTIEPTFGVERTILAILLEAYCEEKVDTETRIVMKFPVRIAPYKIAVLPLVSNKQELIDKSKDIFASISQEVTAIYDEGGAIGRRYRRNDEIGTPLCLTVDFDTIEDTTVTIRDRDSMKQIRVEEKNIPNILSDLVKGKLKF